MPSSAIVQPSGRRQKYLNNKDLLAEIHKSKTSFSSYIDTDYKQHDIIILSLANVDEQTIEDAKRNRAKRLGLLEFNKIKSQGDKKVKLAEVTPNYTTIEKTSLVIRVMTFDHIPEAPGRKKTVKTVADKHEKVNFPPYQHWKFDDEDNLICVGKSHWVGGMANGYFSKEHGRITENLGKMFIKLSERYAQRSNWRGYSYVEEMKGQAIMQLSQMGLQFDESKSDNPFAYYTASVTNSFVRILNLEKNAQNIRDDMLEEGGLTPSMTRQNIGETAVETARQAAIYKLQRMKKSKEEDPDEQQS